MLDIFDALSTLTETMKKVTKDDMIERDPHSVDLVAAIKEKERVFKKVVKDCPEEHSQSIQEYAQSGV